MFEAINRSEWQKVKDAVVPGKVSELCAALLPVLGVINSRNTRYY